MDPRSAKKLIDQVCAEIDAARGQSGLDSFMRKVVRPAGLGLMLSLGAGGMVACDSADMYGVPPGDAYGVTDVPTAGDMYGVHMDGLGDLPPMGDMYGINDVQPQDLPTASDLYGIPADSGGKDS